MQANGWRPSTLSPLQGNAGKPTPHIMAAFRRDAILQAAADTAMHFLQWPSVAESPSRYTLIWEALNVSNAHLA